jgi:hypothetical protein
VSREKVDGLKDEHRRLEGSIEAAGGRKRGTAFTITLPVAGTR